MNRRWKQFHEERDRAKDLQFLAQVRASSEAELVVLARNLNHKSAPMWKRVVVARALAKILRSGV